MRLFYFLFSLLIAVSLYFYIYYVPNVEPIRVEHSSKKIDYLKDIKPILDKRCVSCHSCYNSPCQAKMSSFEGLDRGASKLLVYDASRFKAVDPTRLFIDAKSTEEWRAKDFYSILDSPESNETHNDSIMLHMIHDKKNNPDIIGSYEPEKDKLMCPKNKKELEEYLYKKKNHGMPYGFAALKEKEYEKLAQWIHLGAKGPTPKQQKELITPSLEAKKEIKKWEDFLNYKDAKHSVTSRYLFEHFFLAHINFKAAPKEFYELVRSYTPSGEAIDLIPSLRPFDDPGVKKFYYRFKKIHSTFVHKTHMVVLFDDEKLNRIEKLFIEPKWVQKPHYIDYELTMSTNPFIAFYQIPASARYQLLLDNSHYMIMTFIRGPICRGQMALNVLHDHFWVMFLDPKYDISLKSPEYIESQFDNLSIPIQARHNGILKTLSNKYKNKFQRYFYAKQAYYDIVYPDGLGIDSIWKGEKASDAPILTSYRHYDSASLHKGVLGELPRTMWVMDYPQFERMYYALVAGYDVFGNVSHQMNIRRYMDFLRMEGELNFISYMPLGERLELFKSWYINDKSIEKIKDERGQRGYGLIKRSSGVKYKTQNYKQEFIEQLVNKHILKSTGISFDKLNYYSEKEKVLEIPKVFRGVEDIEAATRSLSASKGDFIRYITDNDVNNVIVRIKLENGESYIQSILVNRWHDNVNSYANKEQSNPSKDTLDFLPFSVGSYPNMFGVVEQKDLADFYDMIQNFDESDKYKAKVTKYFIGRDDEDFWEHFDWFQNNFNESDPINSGLYDLNRYYRYGWEHYGY